MQLRLMKVNEVSTLNNLLKENFVCHTFLQIPFVTLFLQKPV